MRHMGFMSSILTILFVPLLIFVGCTIVRRCRKYFNRAGAAKPPPMMQNNNPYQQQHELDEQQRRQQHQQHESWVQQQHAAQEAIAAPPIAVQKEPPKPLPPVARSLMPVDAYHGVPPKQFVL